MTKTIELTNTQTAINERIEGRIKTAMSAGNEGLANKFERERAKLITTAYAGFFDAKKIQPTAFLDGIAIYALQKVRKMVAQQIDDKAVDSYTMAILKNGLALAKKKMPFTSGLQLASLSQAVECEDKGMTTLKRLSSTKGTATTQASSTRSALQAMGAAKVVKEEGRSVLKIDFANEIVSKALGLNEEDVAKLAA